MGSGPRPLDVALATQKAASDDKLLAPDLTDDQVRRGQMAALRRAQQGQGDSGSFLTGPLADLTKPATAALVKPIPPLGGTS